MYTRITADFGCDGRLCVCTVVEHEHMIVAVLYVNCSVDGDCAVVYSSLHFNR